MKIGEKWEDHDDRTVTVKRTWDAEPYLDRVKMGRESAPVSQEMVYAGSIPGFMLEAWMKEAGLTMDQWDEVKEMVKKKLQSGEFSAFQGDRRLYRNTGRIGNG